MYNLMSSPTVTDCMIESNSAPGFGGGMSNEYESSPTVLNCVFTQNSAGYAGGGMSNDYESSPTVTNCTFTLNSGSFSGGMHNLRSSPAVTNCTFESNSAIGFSGGGMSNSDNSSPTVINCTFKSNSADLHGGGMSNDMWSSPTVMNCTFTLNSGGVGGGMYSDDSGSPTVTNCIMWGDQPNEIYNPFESNLRVTYSLVQGGFEGEGNIDVDPRFVDAANGGLRLRSDSPCIEAGNSTGAPSTDIMGVYRPQGPGIDMGAYEYIGDPQHTLTVTVAGSGTTDPVDGMYPIQQGTVATLRATPTLWWRFDRWEGDLSGSLNPAMLTMDSDKAVTALFVEPAVGSITGTVTNWRTGLALQGVAISVSEPEFEREINAAESDAAGGYALDAPGEISLHVAFDMPNFESVERSGVNAPTVLNVGLEPLWPVPPSNVTAAPGAGNVQISWDPSPSQDVFGYFVYRSDSSDFTSASLLTLGNPITFTTYSDRSGGSGVYNYWVAALDTDENLSEPVGTPSVAVGIVAIFLQDIAAGPGDEVRIPISVQNAIGISPEGMDFNLVYPAELVDFSKGVTVEHSAITSGMVVSTNTTEPGRVRILGLPQETEALLGQGHLFDVVLTLRDGVTGIECGEISFRDFDDEGFPHPGVTLYDSSGALIPVDYDEVRRLCVAGPEAQQPEPGAGCSYRRGDLTEDWLVNSADVLMALKVAVGLETLDECHSQAGDLNADGRIDSADAVMLMRLGVGLPLNPIGVKSLSSRLKQAGSVSVLLDPAAGMPNRWVDIPVRISNTEGLSGFELGVSYPSQLKFVSAGTGALTSDFLYQASAEAGYARIAMSREIELGAGSGEIAVLLSIMQSVTVGEDMRLYMPPPRYFAALPDIVQLATVGDAEELYIPAPFPWS